MTFPINMPIGPRGKRGKTGQGKLRISYLTNALFIRELMEGAATADELVKVTGQSKRTVTNYLMALHRKRCVHIAAWERDASGKQSIRAFAFGERPDAKKQPVLTAGERARNSRLRQLDGINVALWLAA